MPRKTVFGLFLFLPISWLAGSALEGRTSECAVSGQVTDPGGRPIPGARVTLLHTDATAETDAEGRYCFEERPADASGVMAWAEGHAVSETPLGPWGEETPIRLMKAFGDELVVSATRTLKRLSEVPVHVRIVDRETIERTGARSLSEAVEWTSGIRVESTCQNCNQPEIRMLGLSGPYSQILIDSQPTVSSLAVVYGIDQLPARLIDSIEVVKGGGSAVYGGGAVAGVVNLIPHHPDGTGLVADLTLGETSGSDTVATSLVGDWVGRDGDRGLTLFGQVDRADPVDVDGDGFTEVVRRRLEAGGGRAQGFFFSGRARLAGELTYTSEDRRGGDALELPPDRALIAEWIASDRIGGSVGWLHAVSGDLDYRLVASLARTKRDTYYGVGRDPNAYGTSEDELLVLDGQVDHLYGGGTVTWGAQYTDDRLEDVQPAYGRELVEQVTDLGLFLQDDRKLGKRVSVLYGVRVDDHSRVDEPILSPRLALLWTPLHDVSVRASFSNGFRPPVLFDEDLHITLVGGGQAQIVRDDPELREERATSLMLGGVWSPTFGRNGIASFEVNGFRTEIDGLFHEIEDDDPVTPGFELTRINFGEAVVQGGELNFAVRWGDRASFDLGWVEQSGRFSQPEPDFGSRDFFRTPERHGVVSTQWSLPKELGLFVGAIYTGPMKVPHYAGFVPEDRLETTPSTVSVDLSLSRPFVVGTRSLSLTGGVKNLFDEYQEDLDQGPARDPTYVYGPRRPRSLYLSLRFEL